MKSKIKNIQIVYGNAIFKVYIMQLTASSSTRVLYHKHHFYELHFCLEGSYTYKINSEKIIVNPNELLIIPPEVYHDSVTLLPLKDNYKYIVLQFSLDQGEEPDDFYYYFNETLKDSSQKVISISDSLIRQVIEINNLGMPDSIKSFCYAKTKVCMLLFDLFDNLNGFSIYNDSTSKVRDHEESLVLLNSLVNQHHLTLKAIAAELHYSERHTARLIKQMYNMTLSEIYEKDITVSDDNHT